MAVIDKAFSVNIIDNGPNQGNQDGMSSDSSITNYSTEAVSFLIDEGLAQVTVYGSFPDILPPQTLNDLFISYPADSLFIDRYTGSLGPNYEGDSATVGTLISDVSSDLSMPFSALINPFSLALTADFYSGDDTFIASKFSGVADDRMFGFGGNDTFYTYGTGERYDKVYGGDGIDTAVYESPRNYFEIFPAPNKIYNTLTDARDLDGYTVVDRTGDESGDQLVDVERLRFTDTNVALDFGRDQNSFKAAALITTLFGSDSISDYFAPAVGLFDDGMTGNQIAQLVIDLGLVSTSSNEKFVETIYENVIGIAPDSLTIAIYANQLDSGDISHAGLVALGASVPLIENQIEDLGDWRISGLDYFGF